MGCGTHGGGEQRVVLRPFQVRAFWLRHDVTTAVGVVTDCQGQLIGPLVLSDEPHIGKACRDAALLASLAIEKCTSTTFRKPCCQQPDVYSDFENYAGGIYHHTSGSMVGGSPPYRAAL